MGKVVFIPKQEPEPDPNQEAMKRMLGILADYADRLGQGMYERAARGIVRVYRSGMGNIHATDINGMVRWAGTEEGDGFWQSVHNIVGYR